MNANENITYVEYDPHWKFNATDPTGGGLQWYGPKILLDATPRAKPLMFNFFHSLFCRRYELYDLNTDPYQMKNIYSQASAADRTRYHQMAQAAWVCEGSSCL